MVSDEWFWCKGWRGERISGTGSEIQIRDIEGRNDSRKRKVRFRGEEMEGGKIIYGCLGSTTKGEGAEGQSVST
jgi:hypothetical protein